MTLCTNSCRTFLETLDQRNLSNGSAEMLKMACIKDAKLFHILEEHGSSFITGCFQVSCHASNVEGNESAFHADPLKIDCVASISVGM